MKDFMNKNYIIFMIFIGLTLILSSSLKTTAQGKKNLPLKDRRFDLLIHKKSFQDILVELSREYDVPIGFQVTDDVENPSCKQSTNLYLQNATIDQIMGNVISLCPNYSWSITDEVINIFPAISESSLLDIKVAKIEIKERTSEEILDSLFNLREIKSELESNGLSRDNTTAFWQTESKNDRKYSVTLSDKKIRNILNYLILNTEKKAWIYYRLSNDKTAFSLRFFS